MNTQVSRRELSELFFAWYQALDAGLLHNEFMQHIADDSRRSTVIRAWARTALDTNGGVSSYPAGMLDEKGKSDIDAIIRYGEVSTLIANALGCAAVYALITSKDERNAVDDAFLYILKNQLRSAALLSESGFLSTFDASSKDVAIDENDLVNSWINASYKEVDSEIKELPPHQSVLIRADLRYGTTKSITGAVEWNSFTRAWASNAT